MECPRCGTQNDDKRNFCFKCGNPLASNMLDPIDFGKTQATPVVVEPIEPMSKEDALKNTSVIPVISETVEAEPIVLDKDDELKKAAAIRDDLLFTSEMEQVKVNIKQLESVDKPIKKKPIIWIIIIVALLLFSASGISYYLFKKDMIKVLKKETTSLIPTTTEFKVALDTELKATSDEIILNSNSHTLKYSYQITKVEQSYRPVLKVYLDNIFVGESIIQENNYMLKEAYDAILNGDIFTIENQVIRGIDKDYYYINVLVNERFYVFILNETTCIYKNKTEMFNTSDTENIYNNKSSLLKNGIYSYVKQIDETTTIEQISTIENDVVSFTDGEAVEGFWK